MAFGDISTIEGWEDFGFKYHEGINNLRFDDEQGILSFRYTEPSTWWMNIDPAIERTRENVMNLLHQHAQSDDDAMQQAAEATLVSGAFDEQGRYQYLVRDLPWCNGVVFSSNPNPHIPGNSEAKMNWSEKVKETFYGPGMKGELDGEYLDSIEAYATVEENFRREHFHYVTVPLTFSTSSKKPVIHKASSVYELSKSLSRELHQTGKLTFANSAAWQFAFLCPYLDVLGIEAEWIDHDGEWDPPDDGSMNFKRIMSYHKPYLFLMNTFFDRIKPDALEKYFQRCLFYGMFPSMFSHNAADDLYWSSPRFYNRDRHFFKRYMPLIKRVAEAGWEPITYATVDNHAVYLERFGPDAEGNMYLTILNNSTETQTAHVSINETKLNIELPDSLKDLVSEEGVQMTQGTTRTMEITMAPQDIQVYALSGSPGGNV